MRGNRIATIMSYPGYGPSYETVEEHHVRQRQVRVCTECRMRLPDLVHQTSRDGYRAGGSVVASLSGSMLGSMAMGELLGPVGTLVGAIGGAVAGSRAGAAGADGYCYVIDAADTLCDACRGAQNNATGTGWSSGSRVLAGDPDQAVPTTREHIGQAASAAGESVSSAMSTVGGYLGAASAWVQGTGSSARGDDPDLAGSDPVQGTFQGSGNRLGSEVDSELQVAIAASLQDGWSHGGTNGGPIFACELSELEAMGFTDQAKNVDALLANNGNVEAAVEYLLEPV